MTATFPYLIELVEDSAAGLGDITKRRMFGCETLFTRDQIFVLFWKTGRIGVRLPDPAAYAELLALEGSEPWRIGEKAMSHWVLVPEDFHDDAAALTPWIRRAHALASSSAGGAGATKKTAATPAAAAAKKTTTAKKSAANTAPAKKSAAKTAASNTNVAKTTAAKSSAAKQNAAKPAASKTTAAKTTAAKPARSTARTARGA